MRKVVPSTEVGVGAIGLPVYAWLCALLVSGCAAEGGGRLTVQLRLQTDLVAGQEFDQAQVIAVPVGNNASKGHRLTVGIAEDRLFFPADALGELDALTAGDYRIEVELRHQGRGRLVTDRPVLVSVRNNVSLTVPITRSCLNVICDEGEACFGGRCVDAGCSVETPERCSALVDAGGIGASEAQCAADADCALPVSCARTECDLGVCWAVALAADDPNACDPATQWCHPGASDGVGCLPLGEAPAFSASCSDGLQNGDETRVDCGGSCGPCPLSTVIADGCRDGVLSGDETAVDCGGSCTACPADFDCSAQSSVPVHECLALLAFFDATDGARWSISAGFRNGTDWLEAANPCNWHGITCTGGAVTRLVITNADIDGPIPPEIGNLTSLEALYLGGGNRINGAIPPEIGNLASLRELSIQSNALTGVLPAELGDLVNLEDLDAALNDIGGTLPLEVGNLTNLRELNLYGNNLGGTLPKELGGLLSIERLDLAQNNLVGTLPAEFGSLTGLRQCRLNDNQLSGPVPPTWQQMTSLAFLGLRQNNCLWVEDDCSDLLNWLEGSSGIAPEWNLNNGLACEPPPEACQ